MISQIGYLKLLISRSILSGPLDFEIKRAACILIIFVYILNKPKHEHNILTVSFYMGMASTSVNISVVKTIWEIQICHNIQLRPSICLTFYQWLIKGWISRNNIQDSGEIQITYHWFGYLSLLDILPEDPHAANIQIL